MFRFVLLVSTNQRSLQQELFFWSITGIPIQSCLYQFNAAFIYVYNIYVYLIEWSTLWFLLKHVESCTITMTSLLKFSPMFAARVFKKGLSV